jgi:hypothetical protein
MRSDDSVADRFPGGVVAKFNEATTCITSFYERSLPRMVVETDRFFVHISDQFQPPFRTSRWRFPAISTRVWSNN